jgi:hypothetical protein
MKTQNSTLLGAFFLLMTFCLFPGIALAARDLTSAAQSAVSTATGVAKTASVLGIVCGALIYQIPGATQFARATIIGGLIGAALSYGGTSIIALFQSVLGG